MSEQMQTSAKGDVRGVITSCTEVTKRLNDFAGEICVEKSTSVNQLRGSSLSSAVESNGVTDVPEQNVSGVICLSGDGTGTRLSSEIVGGSVSADRKCDSSSSKPPDHTISDSDRVCGKRKRQSSENSSSRSETDSPTATVTPTVSNGHHSDECKNVEQHSSSTENGNILSSKFRHLTRSELEKLVMQQMHEVIASRSAIADMRKSVENQSAAAARFQRKMTRMQKQVGDLHLVVRKLSNELKSNSGASYPVKITRTVGLQVSLSSTSSARLAVGSSPRKGGISRNNDVAAHSSSARAVEKDVISPLRVPAGISVSHTDTAASVRNGYSSHSSKLPSNRPCVTVSNKASKPRVNGKSFENSDMPVSRSVSTDVVDLTDDVHEPPASNLVSPCVDRTVVCRSNIFESTPSLSASKICFHPAPFPASLPNPVVNTGQLLPPAPLIKAARRANGIVLSWTMELKPQHASIVSYHLFAYQEENTNFRVNPWKKVGDVKALPLPMACTLTQFQEGHKYHFAVRAEDSYRRRGAFSKSASIDLVNN